MQRTYTARRIFTGEAWLEHTLVITENGKVIALEPQGSREPDESFPRCILAPAYIDVQVYGAAGRLLSVYPEPATLRRMNEVFLAEGTHLFLPTVATNTVDVFRKAIDAVRDYWKEGGSGVFGLHLEGPWINPEKRGAHIEEWIHAPSRAEVEELLDYGEGIVKMITLAPEVCASELVSLIRDRGILISAGHSGATYRQASEAFDHGIRAVTHLFNAMSPLHHREPGLVGATLAHPGVQASVIPDGHHVDFAAIAIAKKIMGERLFAITDAVTDTTKGPYQHRLAGDKYESGGILSGSSLSMHRAMVNLVRHVGLEWGEALRMCSLYPARLLGRDDLGKIAPDSALRMIVLDEDLSLVRTIIS